MFFLTFCQKLKSLCKTIIVLFKIIVHLLCYVVENWDAINEDIQSNFIKVNDFFFFCGLHFLVGLADQTEASLKAPLMIDPLVLLQMVAIPKVNLVHYR